MSEEAKQKHGPALIRLISALCLISVPGRRRYAMKLNSKKFHPPTLQLLIQDIFKRETAVELLRRQGTAIALRRASNCLRSETCS